MKNGSSPLSRGIPRPVAATWRSARIIPALAGNTPSPGSTTTSPADHPRSRGEYPITGVDDYIARGSSPLSRGIRCPTPPRRGLSRIIPALAGNTSAWMAPSSPSRDHPRSRGEYAEACPDRGDLYGSSPLSRGIQNFLNGGSQRCRIIPALAGNTSNASSTTSMRGDHPRSRGEYRAVADAVDYIVGSSPLSRGIRYPFSRVAVLERIIPALAGNTCLTHTPRIQQKDHPRSRGEYRGMVAEPEPGVGSSPLSRGIPRGTLHVSGSARIIPALAGNTQ